MRVDIRDVKAVRALRPLEVAAYLRANGWTQSHIAPGREAIWTSVAGGEEYEILLPLDQTRPDFSLRMGDLLHYSPLQTSLNRLTPTAFELSDLLCPKRLYRLNHLAVAVIRPLVHALQDCQGVRMEFSNEGLSPVESDMRVFVHFTDEVACGAAIENT